jgi:hypothetical protein
VARKECDDLFGVNPEAGCPYGHPLSRMPFELGVRGGPCVDFQTSCSGIASPKRTAHECLACPEIRSVGATKPASPKRHREIYWLDDDEYRQVGRSVTDVRGGRG